MAAKLFYLPFRPALDANAIIVPGAKLYFYATGTTSPRATYVDDTLTDELTHPVQANAAGVWPAIYLNDAYVYRLVMKDADGAVLQDLDPYMEIDQSALGLSGTYTPTLTNITNVAVSVASVAQYMRVGDVVTVSGRLQVDPTAGGMFDLSITLPIASAITDATQIAGTAVAVDPSENSAGAGAIYGDPPTDKAVLRRTTVGSGNATYAFHFTYLVL